MLKGKIFYFDPPLTGYMTRHYNSQFQKNKKIKILAIKLHIGCNSGLGVRIEGLSASIFGKRDNWLDVSWITTKKMGNKNESRSGGSR